MELPARIHVLIPKQQAHIVIISGNAVESWYAINLYIVLSQSLALVHDVILLE